MAQYAVPDSDIVDGNWLDEGSGNTDLYDGLVPDTPGSIGASDDDTYIESPSAPSSEACGFGLSNVEDPVSSSGHVMRWRRGKNAAGGATINLTVELRMGYISEGTPGTEIHSEADNDIPDTATNDSYTLSGGEADAITDYTDLQARFVANQP